MKGAQPKRGTEASGSNDRCRRQQREPSRHELLRENERLRKEVERLQKKLAEDETRFSEQQERISEQQEQIADLERQLAQSRKNSRNSSKPPSSDGLAGEQRERGRQQTRKRKSKRKPGGQPGHPGKHRKLVDTDQVNRVVTVLPPQCKHCGEVLSGQEERVGDPQRVQVWELPPIQADITEYQCLKLQCSCCNKSTRAEVPQEAQDPFGPGVTALVAYLTVVCRMPRRVTELFLERVLGIEMSLGSVQNCWEQASDAVQAPYEELQQQLRHEPVLNVDETGWRNNGDKRWIWGFVALRFTFYTIAKDRSAEVLAAMLGAIFAGILCSDRLATYGKYHKGLAQWCWAHLQRTLQGMLDFARTLEAEHFARAALKLSKRLFRLWRRFKSGAIDRPQLMAKSKPILKGFRRLAEDYWNSADREVSNFATAIGQHFDRLFCFLEQEGVEPTNNSVEQALRTAVQWRKICFGNRSECGERATARLLTVTQTCARQGRNSLVYLTDAIRNHRRGLPSPSLLPSQQ